MSTSTPPAIAAKLARLPDPDDRCHLECPGWCVMNDSEIQTCDQCWDGIPDPLTDREAGDIPAARAEMAIAQAHANRHRKIEMFSRRTVVVKGNLLRSPCCDASVAGGASLAMAGTVHLTSKGPRVSFSATSAHIDEVRCAECGRRLQMPAGLDKIVVAPHSSDDRSGRDG